MNREISHCKLQEFHIVKASLTTSMSSTKYKNPFSDMYSYTVCSTILAMRPVPHGPQASAVKGPPTWKLAFNTVIGVRGGGAAAPQPV